MEHGGVVDEEQPCERNEGQNQRKVEHDGKSGLFFVEPWFQHQPTGRDEG